MGHNRGGKREGAGRPSSGKSKVQFWISEDEAIFLRKMLSEYREGLNLFETDAPTPNTLSISELSKKNTPPETSPFFTKTENCPKCGSELLTKISSLSGVEYLECTGANCIFTTS